IAWIVFITLCVYSSTTGGNAEIIAARHYAIYLIRKTTKLSQASIAKLFNKKDHTTVINSLNFIERKIENEPAFGREIENVIKELRS
ncbi:MAG: hypothetical protein IIX67_04725, partial [Clostridia bacterium]|nr:hypothetical protein [Clostridia bacterium]